MAFFDELAKVLHIGEDDEYVRVVRDPRCNRRDAEDEYDDEDDDSYDDEDIDWD